MPISMETDVGSPQHNVESSQWERANAPDADGCPHYRRRCEVQAPCCSRFFSCHLCHDESPRECQESFAHLRYAVTRIRCKACGTEQDVTASCTSCRTRFAKYFCGSCRLYATPGAEGIYHCHLCGICRVGQGLGQSHFHCVTCQGDFGVDVRVRA